MASLYALPMPIAQPIPRHVWESLKHVQGNILRPHGRNHAAHIFLHFNAPEALKDWLHGLAADMTSAQQQLEESEQYRVSRQPGRVFKHIALSASGYAYLGYPRDRRDGFTDSAFLSGMKAAQHRLNDPPTAAWERGYRQDIHAMLLLANDQEHRLRREIATLCTTLKACAEICAIEYGHVLRNAQGKHVEHFGYVDGLSEPLFFERDMQRARQLGEQATLWSTASPDLVLVPDPYGAKENGRPVDSGSFLVFRKLEQYVRAFKAREQELAQALGPRRDYGTNAGALAVGRFKDGTPLALFPTDGHPTNSFSYDDDPEGAHCPLQAHIRKVNPRQSGTPRIVRRGIPYGDRQKGPQEEQSLEEYPQRGVGLLFMCYQKSIVQQFEYLQMALANETHYPRSYEPGIDALIGQPGGSGVGKHRWPRQWGDPRERHTALDFSGFVSLRGGEYFFAPSISFLQKCKNAS